MEREGKTAYDCHQGVVRREERERRHICAHTHTEKKKVMPKAARIYIIHSDDGILKIDIQIKSHLTHLILKRKFHESHLSQFKCSCKPMPTFINV